MKFEQVMPSLDVYMKLDELQEKLEVIRKEIGKIMFELQTNGIQ